MKAVVDRIVQYANRYKLTNVETGEELGTFDFDEVTGTVQQVGTEIDKELFDSIADDLAARVVSSGGELKDTVVTFTDLTGTASNVASGDKTSTLWSKVKNWFSRLKALAFKDKISNADVANDANIAQSKIDGLRTEQYGVQIGTAAVCSGAGAAVGSGASATNGGAVGSVANVTSGGAVGNNAKATTGGAVGNNASATSGGAVGNNAKATEDGAVQLGSGTNDNANTLQFRGYQIVDANGNIPAQRLSANSPVRSVNKKTGAVTLAKGDVGLGNVDNVKQYSASNPPPYPVTSVNGETGNVEIPLDFLPLSGGNISGNISAQYITGTWLQATAANHQTSAASKIAVFDGSGWLYYRTSAELLSDIGAAAQQTTQGGFQGGEGTSTMAGGAVGQNASAQNGGAVGSGASVTAGGAVGQNASAGMGAAVGYEASATTGGAVGQEASATTGFAGGKSAISEASGAVQLAEGRNKTSNTLQFRNYQLCDASGNIPAERLSANSPVRSVNEKTGAVSLSAADVGAATPAQVNSVSMVPYGGQATTLSALASGGVYSISANGYLRIAYQTTAADNYITMKQVSSSGADMWGFLANGQKTYGSGYPYIYMPVANGDHIKVEFNSSVKIIQVQLIKVKGVQ